jgi:hypothetical protein
MHRVHFNQLGVPIFDLAGDRDFKIALSDVVTEIKIKG